MAAAASAEPASSERRLIFMTGIPFVITPALSTHALTAATDENSVAMSRLLRPRRDVRSGRRLLQFLETAFGRFDAPQRDDDDLNDQQPDHQAQHPAHAVVLEQR